MVVVYDPDFPAPAEPVVLAASVGGSGPALPSSRVRFGTDVLEGVNTSPVFDSFRSSPPLRSTAGTALRRVKPKKVSFDGKPSSNSSSTVKGAANASGPVSIGKLCL